MTLYEFNTSLLFVTEATDDVEAFGNSKVYGGVLQNKEYSFDADVQNANGTSVRFSLNGLDLRV
ncbi:hypothetical protein GCM10023149_37720 [Mucilaginibacter gynuensis]|uniref:Uncharacterized protein n=1 Tax=Mucilaginibacter gynuensis TaxID=1302236 RepID=A0ABP8GYR5_9SPHI